MFTSETMRIFIKSCKWVRNLSNKMKVEDFYHMSSETSSIYSGILNQDRDALSRAITLVESKSSAIRHEGESLLYNLLKHKNESDISKDFRSLRVGITGSPGVGKSSLIDKLGQFVVSEQHKMVVLTIDPTSEISGGSILGDKTRMRNLVNNPSVYIRPSPNSCVLGGITRSTMDTIYLCELSGYDMVFVETVGVGQSETSVDRVCDIIILLLSPTGGDYLQGIKRGINEVANIIVINKCDGDLISQANETESAYKSSINLKSLNSEFSTEIKVLKISAEENKNIDHVWSYIKSFWTKNSKNGAIDMKRKQNLVKEMWISVEDEIINRLKLDKNRQSQEVEKMIMNNILTPQMGAHWLVDSLDNKLL